MLFNLEKLFDVNTGYVSSWQGMLTVSLLASGGGVFGIMARVGVQNSSATTEFLFWVSIFAWVTSLLGLFYSAYNPKPLSTRGLVQHSLTVAILYVLATVLFGVYDTFGTSSQTSRFVFALAVFTAVGYIEKAIFEIIQLIKESTAGNANAQNGGSA